MKLLSMVKDFNPALVPCAKTTGGVTDGGVVTKVSNEFSAVMKEFVMFPKIMDSNGNPAPLMKAQIVPKNKSVQSPQVA